MNAIDLTILTLLIITSIRNVLVYIHIMKRLKEIHDRNVELINSNKDPDLDAYHSLPNQVLLIFDLRKWTYKQCFPTS